MKTKLRAPHFLPRVLCLILVALLLSTAALADCIGCGTVTASALNVRSSASTGASVVTTLSNGTTVLVTEKADGWYKIYSGGTVGYVSADYLSFSETGTADFGTGTVTGSGVNLRSGASTANSVVANVSKGTTLPVTGVNGTWYQVNYNGTTAYIRSDYLSLSGSNSSSTTTGSSSSGSSSSSETGTINGTYVRLRSGASTSSSILAVFNKGDTVTITGTSGDWYQVNYNGTSGYVYQTYVTKDSVGSNSSGSSGSSETGTINGTDVRFRSGASTSSSILGVFGKGDTVTITGTSGDWYQVSYNGTSGYVYKTYVTKGSTSSGSSESFTVSEDSGDATIRGTYVRVRSGPSTSSSILAVVNTGDKMSITGKTGDWYRVSYNGSTGYVYSSYLIKDSEAQSTAVASSSSSSGSSAGNAIVATAKQYLGVPYVYGGTSPSGFDCSGLVYYVYKQNGYSVYRTATAQYQNGSYVERSDLQPGDILIFYNSGMTGIGHAGIYIGDNQFIHASSGGGKVMISSLSQDYYNTHYYGARRVVS